MVLFLVSVIYEVFLSVKDLMLLYELKMVIYIDIHLAIDIMCGSNCSRCLKVGKHCRVNTPGKNVCEEDCIHTSGILRSTPGTNPESNVILCGIVLQ